MIKQNLQEDEDDDVDIDGLIQGFHSNHYSL